MILISWWYPFNTYWIKKLSLCQLENDTLKMKPRVDRNIQQNLITFNKIQLQNLYVTQGDCQMLNFVADVNMLWSIYY